MNKSICISQQTTTFELSGNTALVNSVKASGFCDTLKRIL